MSRAFRFVLNGFTLYTIKATLPTHELIRMKPIATKVFKISDVFQNNLDESTFTCFPLKMVIDHLCCKIVSAFSFKKKRKSLNENMIVGTYG